MKKGLYYILYTLLWLFSLLPLWVHYVIADIICVLVYHVVGYRKALVRKNLADSFPDKTAEELRAIEKAFYHSGRNRETAHHQPEEPATTYGL